MEELIFFAIIIIFSILDSIARSRKKKQREGGTTPLPEESEEWSLEPDELPTYDEEPSYDELPSYDEIGTRSSSSSEAMIPEELWEEIAGLAQGRQRQLEKPEPEPLPVPTRTSRAPVEVRASTHHVHLARAGYGTDPSSRAPSAEDGLDPLAAKLSANAAAVHKQLRRGGRHALRQAVILQEVLGPPASTREYRFEE